MAQPLPARIEAIMQGVRQSLSARHRAREQALPLCREVIRYSANGIRAIHRDDFTQAANLFSQASATLAQAHGALQGHTEIYFAGFLQDAEKEHAEAALTLALVRGDPLPDPVELGIGVPPYLNGMGEAVGELRRYLLDKLRRGEVERCEAFLQAMDDIYDVLVTVDYPDALTGGLRRTTDVARSILERTRGDLTTAVRQRDLELQLRAFEQTASRFSQGLDTPE